MLQHPIPQNVTTYQFRLIGDMTIKQFIFLSAGVGFAIFFYYTNLFSLIKWTLVAGSAMIGFAIAFLPLEERPLDQWIVNYLRAIYRPTRFSWKKNPEPPAYFDFVASASILPADAQELARAAAIRKQQGLRSYLVTLPQDQSSNLDQQVEDQISGYVHLFTETPNPAPVVTAAANILSNINPVVTTSPASSVPPPPTISSHTGSVDSVNSAPVAIDKSAKQPPSTSNSLPINAQSHPTSSTLTAETISDHTVSPTTSPTLPFPSSPATPNTVVGMILDSNNKIVDNAIVEVLDESNLPVRATKTNQLGQFFSTTPLKRGTYHITVEKPGLSFDTIKLQLTGQIVEPLKIQAKS